MPKVAGEKPIRAANASYHRVITDIEDAPKFGRGRPVEGKPRTVLRQKYELKTTIVESPEKVMSLRIQAGCFVLLSNLVDQQQDWPGQEFLTLYKSQIGIEKNFSFLQDPAILNAIFLKKAERIEVLGLILLRQWTQSLRQPEHWVKL